MKIFNKLLNSQVFMTATIAIGMAVGAVAWLSPAPASNRAERINKMLDKAIEAKEAKEKPLWREEWCCGPAWDQFNVSFGDSLRARVAQAGHPRPKDGIVDKLAKISWTTMIEVAFESEIKTGAIYVMLDDPADERWLKIVSALDALTGKLEKLQLSGLR